MACKLFYCDCRYRKFSGRLAQVAPSLKGFHWFHDGANRLAAPFRENRDAISVIALESHADGAVPGVITRAAWRHLANELSAAADDPTTTAIALRISSVAQQVAGFGEAIRALRRAAKVKPTYAQVNAAGGLAVTLAAACHLVIARPAAPIGWLSSGYPLGGGERYAPDRTDQLLESEAVRSRFADETLVLLRNGSMHGEQLEGRGVNHLMS